MNKKIFYDTEFIEGFKDDNHFIDLISIGMVKESGETFYAISKDYIYDYASPWVKENVILPIYLKSDLAAVNYINVSNFHKWVGMKNSDIAKAIKSFVDGEKIDLYGYYADYDHVLLSSLFGTMMDLPHNFPMYTRDIMQIIDGFSLDIKSIQEKFPQEDEHNALSDAKWNRDVYIYIKKLIESKKND